MSTPTTCKVVAPATLKEGATFEATVDGITFTATVPEGGVGEGDTFEVAYPSKSEVNAFEVPSGEFRHTLCSCFNSCCCVFMMGWCCSTCVVGQGKCFVSILAKIKIRSQSAFVCMLCEAIY